MQDRIVQDGIDMSVEREEKRVIGREQDTQGREELDSTCTIIQWTSDYRNSSVH